MGISQSLIYARCDPNELELTWQKTWSMDAKINHIHCPSYANFESRFSFQLWNLIFSFLAFLKNF
jgi:hypothetical protein